MSMESSVCWGFGVICSAVITSWSSVDARADAMFFAGVIGGGVTLLVSQALFKG